MVQRTIPISSVQETVTRPIALSVVRDVLRMLNIGTLNGKPDGQFIFNLNGSQTPLPQSTLYHNEASLRLPGDIKIELSLQEVPTEHAALVMTHAAETRYVFADIANRVYVKPIYVPLEATLNIAISGQSRSQVMDIHRMLMVTVQQQGRFLRHEVAYNYIVPRYVMYTLIDIHRCREANGGYGVNTGTYLKQHFTESMRPISDSNGGQKNFTIAETGILINGNFTYQETPVPEKGDSIGEWMISFEYRYHYERPDFLHVGHPITIHNQLLDQRFLELNTLISPELYRAQYGQLQGYFGSTRCPPHPEDFYYRQPYFDDWQYHYKPRYMDVMITYLAGVSEDRPQLLLNLLDVEHFTIKKPMLDFMKDVGDLMLGNDETILRVTVHEWDELLGIDQCQLDEHLTLSIDGTVDVRMQYHAMLGSMKRFSDLNPANDHYLIKHGEFFRDYLNAYYPQYVSYSPEEALRKLRLFPQIYLTDSGSVDERSFYEVTQDIRGRENGAGSSGKQQAYRFVNRLDIIGQFIEVIGDET